MVELQIKIKNLNSEIVLLEDENQNLARDKHRFEKRYEEVQKLSEENREKELQLLSINENEHATQIAWPKK